MTNNEREPSGIVIEFAAPGSAEFNVHVQAVGPTQMLGVAEYLRVMAERQLNDAWSAEAMQRAKEQHAVSQVQSMIKRH